MPLLFYFIENYVHIPYKAQKPDTHSRGMKVLRPLEAECMLLCSVYAFFRKTGL